MLRVTTAPVHTLGEPSLKHLRYTGLFMHSGRDVFHKYRFWMDFLIRISNAIPTPLLSVVGHMPGNAGVLGRYLWAKKAFRALGDVCYIAPSCVFKNTSELSIGDRFSIHQFSYIDALGGVSIGNDVAIAHGSSILSSNHQWHNLDAPIKYNEVVRSPVEIGNDVWIGCGVRILPGTHIHPQVVVAAGAVVRGVLESGFLYGGVPAKKIRALSSAD